MSAKTDLLVANRRVSFSVAAPQVLGSDFGSVLVNARLNYDLASRLGYSPSQLHNLVYPYIKNNPGVSNDPRSYEYIEVTKPGGSTTLLGLPWIVESSILTAESTTWQYQISNMGIVESQLLDEWLKTNGFKTFTKIALDNT
jgi:hypothetical protein